MSDAVPGGRLVSLDAFRGITIAAMVLVNNPGSWAHVYPPLAHAEWHGWTLTDLVFPFFLFIMGVAMPFSFARRLQDGEVTRLWPKVLRRALILFALGLLLAAFPRFELANLRWVGVLQRIALVYLATSAIVLLTGKRAWAAIAAALLLGYWAAMTFIPVPGIGAGVLTPEGNLAAWIDERLVPGRMYRGSWDPEGLFSTLPAIATALAGVLTGTWIRSRRRGSEIAAGMFAAGWAAILAGLAWGIWFPINKNLWTSSYVLFTAGAALQGLALCYWLIEVRGWRGWAAPAIVYGLNSIAIFVLSGLVTKMLYRIEVGRGAEATSLVSWLYRTVFLPWASPPVASLAFAVAYVVLWWALAALLYRRGVFIKI